MRTESGEIMGSRTRLTRRILLGGAAGSAGALALAACGGAAATPESVAPPPAETPDGVETQAAAPTLVSALMALRGQSDMWQRAWDRIFAKFTAAHPAYTLEINDSTLAGVTSRAATFMAAGFTFDAIYGSWEWLGLFVDAGIIQSLDPQLANDAEVAPADFHEFGMLKHKDITYGLAWQLTAHPFWSNDDAFLAAGLKTPAELEDAGNWTWDAVLAAAVELTTRDGAAIAFGGLQVYPMLTTHLLYHAWAWGADLWDEGCAQATCNTPAFAAAVQYCVDLFAAHRVIGGDFLRGTQGMVERATAGLPRFEAEIAARDLFAIGMAPRPRGPNGDRATVMTPGGIFIGAGAKNAEGAWAFIKHTVSATVLPELTAIGQGRFTANMHLQPLTVYPYENAAHYEQMARTGRPAPRLRQQRAFDAAWRATWDAMVEGSLTVAAGVAQLQERVQGWIDTGGCVR